MDGEPPDPHLPNTRWISVPIPPIGQTAGVSPSADPFTFTGGGLFVIPTWAVALFLTTVIIGAAVIGVRFGRGMRVRLTQFKEPIAVVQTTLLGFVGLLLAFGLSMGVGRYDERRVSVIDEANAIGTAYLRSLSLPDEVREPTRQRLRAYVEVRVAINDRIPGERKYEVARLSAQRINDELWALAIRALEIDPVGSGTRLYVEALNHQIDMEAARAGALNNRIPGPVLTVQIIGSIAAVAMFGLYIGLLGRSFATVLTAAVVIVLILLVIVDLDRPVRGVISTPNAPLVEQRDLMRATR
jgi:hypothetical protein